MGNINLARATDLAKIMIQGVLNEGDLVVDGTMGNGNDTLFLAQIVGPEGKVISFDIQDIAIENTKKLLKNSNMFDRALLIHDGHENIDIYVKSEIAGAMFNLGYLPKGDHEIVTTPKTTILSIEKCLDLLKKGGTVTIVIYHGHLGGPIEKDQVIEFTEKLDQNKFHVLKMEYINQENHPPILIAIVKK